MESDVLSAQKWNAAHLLTAVLLAALSLNPLTERLDASSATVLMFSHYALFLCGFALVYGRMRLKGILIFPAALLAALWHLPYLFDVSATTAAYRIGAEASMFISGLLISGTLPSLSRAAKGIMFLLWFISDTALSILFIIRPGLYSKSGETLSPFASMQFIELGIAMIFFMNAVLAVVVIMQGRKYAKGMADGHGE